MKTKVLPDFQICISVPLRYDETYDLRAFISTAYSEAPITLLLFKILEISTSSLC